MFGMEKGILGIGGDPATLRRRIYDDRHLAHNSLLGHKDSSRNLQMYYFHRQEPDRPERPSRSERDYPSLPGVGIVRWASGNTVQMLDCYE